MESKKQLILEVALSSFSQKGYYSTSVQEIASQCGISKGSLYKYFSSKEELFIEICEYNQNQLFEKFASLDDQRFTTPKEWLQKHIEVQMEDFLQKKDFILMQFKEMPFHENEQLKKLKVRMRSRIMQWQYKQLIKAYGPHVEPVIWDTIMMMQGMIKEYLFLIMNTKQYDLVRDSSRFIANRIDDFIHQRETKKEPPVITKSIISKEILFEHTEWEDTVSSILEEIQLKVDAFSNESRKEEYLSVLTYLKEELENEKPRKYLLEALLSYLEKEEQLIVLIKKARMLIQQEVTKWNI